MLEFIDSGVYIVQDVNNFINPLLQVGSVEKVPDPDPAGQKSTNPTGSGSSSLLKPFHSYLPFSYYILVLNIFLLSIAKRVQSKVWQLI